MRLSGSASFRLGQGAKCKVQRLQCKGAKYNLPRFSMRDSRPKHLTDLNSRTVKQEPPSFHSPFSTRQKPSTPSVFLAAPTPQTARLQPRPMLPPSHIAYTVAALDEIQRRSDVFDDADYRWVIVAAVAPDLIDKPLAWAYFYRRYKSAVLFAHTLLVHIAVPLLTLWKAPQRMIYALAFNGHAMLDRLWLFQNTWYWPFRGWQFHVWQKRGSEQEAIGLAYWYAFTRRPELWGWELGGMIAGLRFLWRNRLWERERLWHLVRTGRLKR